MDHAKLTAILDEQMAALQRLSDESTGIMLEVAEAIVDCFRRGGKMLLFGNGGSAADAQHVAAEMVGRFSRERRGLPVVALTTDSSILTAVGNDYGFDHVFARQVEALAKVGDIAVGISTSGKSPNVIMALKRARDIGAKTIGFTGENGGGMSSVCDICFRAPANRTARIQELHIAAWHAVCDLVEEEIIRDD